MLDWTYIGNEKLATQRIVWASDGQEGYIAALPLDITLEQAVDDFVSTYDNDGMPAITAEEVAAIVIETYDPRRAINEQT